MKTTKDIAIDFLKNKRFKECISLFSTLIETTDNDSSIYFYRSQAFNALNEINNALNDLNTAIQINSQSPGYFKARGIVYYNLNQFSDAIADFTECLNLKTDDNYSRWLRCLSFAAIGNLSNSFNDAEKLCLQDPTNHEYFAQKGYCLLQLGKFSDSIEAYEKAIKFSNNRPEYSNDLGFAKINSYLEIGDSEILYSAIKSFDKALIVDPLFADSYYRRGWSKYLLAVFFINNDLAFEFVPQCDPNEPENVNKFRMQIVDNLTPLINDALKDLFRSIILYEQNNKAYANYRIAQCYDLEGKKGRAVKFIDEAISLQPANKSFIQFKSKLIENSNHNLISDDFPECQTCGDSNDVIDPGGSYWWCSHCEHSIDHEGNCVSEDCETCEKEDPEDTDIDNEDESGFPECQTCGDSNDVIDPGGSYWWCSHCEHSIDQEGNCVSDECETCEKDPFIPEHGPFYLFFDTETTGVPRDWRAPITNFDNWPRIVQLAWLVYDSKGNQILKNEYIIKPEGYEIPIDASNVHGITTQYALEFGVPIEEVLLHFEKHCEKSKYLIAHNINFDSKVAGSEYLRILSRNPISKLENMCTMASSTNYCKIPGNYGYKWPKLSELHVKLFGVDFEGAHDALADIEATAKCFWEMRKLKLI